MSQIAFGYTNYRGEFSRRRAVVKSIRWGSTEWHPTPQWLMLATDLDKGEDREFAMRDMNIEGLLAPFAVLDEAAKPAPGGPKMREGWQPIETLRTDHGYVLGTGPCGYRGAPFRVKVCRREAHRYNDFLVDHAGIAFTDDGEMATHWMPLPAPPEPTVPDAVPLERVEGEGE